MHYSYDDSSRKLVLRADFVGKFYLESDNNMIITPYAVELIDPAVTKIFGISTCQPCSGSTCTAPALMACMAHM